MPQLNKFLKRIIYYFLIPFLVYCFIEGVLPATTYTFRYAEGLQFKSRLRIPHLTSNYPNIDSKGTAEGDLCHHTSNAIVKKEDWKTDKLGFRNNQFIEQADIILIGDSYIQGVGLSQEETLGNQIITKSDSTISVYSMGPSSIVEFIRLMNLGLIKPPKVMIYSQVERHRFYPILMPTERTLVKDKIKWWCSQYSLNVFLDKATRLYSLDWMRARIKEEKGRGVKAIEGSNMFFLNGKNQPYDKKVPDVVKKIKTYKMYFESIGVRFIFYPNCNKESVYYDYVPFDHQPDFLLRLDTALQKEQVETINTLQIFNNYRATHSDLLYHLDDTHWNPTAVGLIADEIIRKYKKTPLPEGSDVTLFR
ncbi:hypothetical protein KMW28_22820 [Flammeovirga yaeyamensis]|uniref:AlgX/AlgJ SGNH hydrolase-like domain-containing protein n=1 Tax=Flammeovirga yaeyamensis TaxID=367791 RepID=A0AAX1NF86_9BACT|nr:hypothetical protein [Flammeovirga yaeyamensis]MBB3696803.1 hypothetical protein [Flammeovirga yaeyamensis]NMF33469.1 hypothetical protein [Flammeovirga yaeyamensis]QWG05257.1 hypothetical protein KMW28_22820 [Flammeovirga yaeyamensis]